MIIIFRFSFCNHVFSFEASDSVKLYNIYVCMYVISYKTEELLIDSYIKQYVAMIFLW